jgi:hypothetical protein
MDMKSSFGQAMFNFSNEKFFKSRMVGDYNEWA